MLNERVKKKQSITFSFSPGEVAALVRVSEEAGLCYKEYIYQQVLGYPSGNKWLKPGSTPPPSGRIHLCLPPADIRRIQASGKAHGTTVTSGVKSLLNLDSALGEYLSELTDEDKAVIRANIKPSKRKRDIKIGVYVERKEYTKLKRRAKASELSISSYIRLKLGLDDSNWKNTERIPPWWWSDSKKGQVLISLSPREYLKVHYGAKDHDTSQSNYLRVWLGLEGSFGLPDGNLYERPRLYLTEGEHAEQCTEAKKRGYSLVNYLSSQIKGEEIVWRLEQLKPLGPDSPRPLLARLNVSKKLDEELRGMAELRGLTISDEIRRRLGYPEFRTANRTEKSRSEQLQ